MLTSSPPGRAEISKRVNPLCSYRFNGEPMPFLHDHRRRVPTQDVDCSIVVGIGAETAAPEQFTLFA